MDNQTKFVLTVDADGAVVQVQRLGQDGSLSDVPLREFFGQITIPSGAFSGSGTLVIQAFAVAPQDPGPRPQIPEICPPPPPPPPPPAPESPPERPPSGPDVNKKKD